jgi:hypothetical protein
MYMYITWNIFKLLVYDYRYGIECIAVIEIISYIFLLVIYQNTQSLSTFCY